jgi:hypothetical protein
MLAEVGHRVAEVVEELPDDLIFHVNYLGGDMPVFQINFSRPAGQIIASYYNLLRLGHTGYRNIHQASYDIGQYLAAEIVKLGPFELLCDSNPNTGIPTVTWRIREGENPGYTLFDLAERLRGRGWQVPAYTLTGTASDIAVQRILVRLGVSRDMAALQGHPAAGGHRVLRPLESRIGIRPEDADHGPEGHHPGSPRLGAPPERAFATWGPEPIAAASIGQVHRAITHDGHAVAVKVQYPGIAETIEADLGNVALLRPMLKITAPAQDAGALLAELRERVSEELDYRAEARNQRLFADYYRGHPTIHVPEVVEELSTRRVFTSELSYGARFAELAGWPQAERDLAAETIYRFVFRSLYGAHAFNGDPHPGNYLFHGGGKVTFLDFGLVKHFSPSELRPLVDMVRCLCVDNDPEAFRRANEDADVLIPDAPVPTQTVVEQMAIFYDMVRARGPQTMTGEYAAAVAGRFVDLRSPLAAYVQLPRSYVILQRINLGLYALLGELSATADWRRISEEIWPFVQGPPSTPIGLAEAAWRAERAGFK